MQTGFLRTEQNAKEYRLELLGQWRICSILEISDALRRLSVPLGCSVVVNGRSLQALDTATAMVLLHFLKSNHVLLSDVRTEDLSGELANILELVNGATKEPSPLRDDSNGLGFIGNLGLGAVEAFEKTVAVLRFVGETHVTLMRVLSKPRSMRFRETVNQFELVCIDAIPIVCLVTGLIGIVVAYLFATQIEKYGANIFIVDGVATAMWRELSPIIVAIIVAGRSGSAFTAQLGTMKLNQEIDALRTLGLSPMQVLVLPRLVALVLAMPLLVFVGDIVGVAASMVVADLQLGISGFTFVDRLQSVMRPRTMIVGLIKAPVFAAFVAMIGCRMGFHVENNALSVGQNTTSTVVQSIVSVILLNAAFAIIFVELGI